MKIIIIDNYDSFTYNLFQYIAVLAKSAPLVFYNDKLSLHHLPQLRPDALIISSGAGNPLNKHDFGLCSEIIMNAQIPLLGICLGHQGIGSVFGAPIIHAPEVIHGRESNIYHNGKHIFQDIPQGFAAIRYHSLIIDGKNLPSQLVKTAWTEDNVIMGIQHREKPLFGVQFHPESVGTNWGKTILKNFLKYAKN